MKINLTLLACMAIITFPFAKLHAQSQSVHFGVKAGINVSNFSRTPARDNRFAKSGKLLPGYSAGAYATLQSGHFAIEPAIYFTTKGGKTTEDGSIDDIIYDNYGTMRLYYLQVPVNIQYYFPAQNGSYFIGAGPYIGKALSGSFSPTLSDDREIGEAYRDSYKQDITFGNGIRNKFKSFDYGVNAVAGFKFKSGFLINLHYDLGLSNIQSQNYAYKSTRTRSAGILAGYQF